MAELRILYDGWPLVHAPLSPHAIHLKTLLACLPREVNAIVAFPHEPPAGFEGMEIHIQPTPNKSGGRLRWEQRILPKLVRKFDTAALHLTTPTPPLLGDIVTLVSICEYGGSLNIRGDDMSQRGFAGRLRASFASGGMSQLSGYLWPDDLPGAGRPINLRRLPPMVPLDFRPENAQDSSYKSINGGRVSQQLDQINLPDTYILYHGPSRERDLEQLLAAWRWAAPSIGEYYPLLLVGLSSHSQQVLDRLAISFGLAENLYALPEITPELLPELYRKSHAVFHPAPASPWSGAVRLALASGKPLVAAERELTDAIVGPAAYLAPAADGRALGAALVTIVVEEQIAGELSRAAAQRAANWREKAFSRRLLEIYRQLS